MVTKNGSPTHSNWLSRQRPAACARSSLQQHQDTFYGITPGAQYFGASAAMDAPFPIDIQDFDGDDRISFSKLDSKFIAVRDDGAEFEFDTEQRVWKPLDEPTLEEDASNPSAPQDPQGAGSVKRRLEEDDNSTEVSKQRQPAAGALRASHMRRTNN